MMTLKGLCPACDQVSRFTILSVVTETKDSILHTCQCHQCKNQVLVATAKLPNRDYKPILTKGEHSEDHDSSPHSSSETLIP
jgi:hypothetical protein